MASGIGDPEPGDLIEIKRPLYDHWALYVGDGYVIHVTTVDGETLSRSRCRSGSAKRNKAVVRKELFEEVVRNEVWFVNNKYDYGWTPLPAEKIIQHAESWVNKEWRYGLVKKNCEHFVTMLRYGKSFSRQVLKAFLHGISVIGTGTTVGASVALVATGVATGVVAGAVGVVTGVAATAGVGLVTFGVRVAEYCLYKIEKKRKNYLWAAKKRSEQDRQPLAVCGHSAASATPATKACQQTCHPCCDN